MNEETFEKRLAELEAEINGLPATERAKLEILAAETRNRHAEIKDTIARAQESIENLRLSLKYLLFDLEATRRENKALRKQLEGDGK
jgi:uncharacterized coiled-coil protein SlyX